MGLSHKSVMLGQGLLGCKNAALKTNEWIAQMMVVECHKRFSLPSLDTNWFSDEMVKAQSKKIFGALNNG